MPVFADFSRQAHDLGAFGNGMKMKFVANLLVAIHNVASAEAMVLGIKAGLDPAQILKLISAGAGNSRVFELRAPMMVEDRYDGDNVTMRISTWQKDMKVIGEYAASVGCPTPLFSACEPIYRAALSTGHARAGYRARCARCWSRWRASNGNSAPSRACERARMRGASPPPRSGGEGLGVGGRTACTT